MNDFLFTANGLLQIGLYFVVLLLLVKPVGLYIAAVYEGEALKVEKFLGPFEHLFYKLSGVDNRREMGWNVHLPLLSPQVSPRLTSL